MSVLASRRSRSSSEPVLRLSCSSYSRERSRKSDLSYEKGKDRLAFRVGTLGFEEACSLLQGLVYRCPLNQLQHLWTSMESVPHRDFLSRAGTRGSDLRPLSTPVSREVTVRLKRSRLPQNKHLHRVQSAVVHSSAATSQLANPSRSNIQLNLKPEATPTSKLPGLHGHTSPAIVSSRPHTRPQTRLASSHLTSHTPWSTNVATPPTRLLTPVRRHMLSPSHHEAWLEDPRPPSSADTLQFLIWFSQLEHDWQQQEVLQLVVCNLDHKELYYLSALLMSRQYRDFISQLPGSLAHRVLAFVPAKDILQNCCRVTKAWNKCCSKEQLWKTKCHQARMGLPMRLSWKRLFLDDLRLKKNWSRGRYQTSSLVGHTKRVLCVRLKDDLAATGSADCTIRVWQITTGECIATLYGHSRSVWCVCFYGKNLLISGSYDHSIKIWNYTTGLCEKTLEGHYGAVWSIQQKKEVLISGSHDKTVSMYNVHGSIYKVT